MPRQTNVNRFIPVLLLVALALPLSAIKPAGQSPTADALNRGIYFGQTPPGETPVPFAPEILASLSPWVESTAFSRMGTSFSPPLEPRTMGVPSSTTRNATARPGRPLHRRHSPRTSPIRTNRSSRRMAPPSHSRARRQGEP